MPDPSQRRRHSRLPRVKKSGDDDPRMIGQWKIGRTIGKGSSGRVKLARHVKTHQYAAIKIVSKTALINSRISMTDAPAHAEKVLLSIEREIVIMKLIDHPNVLSLYDVWETANELYLIMEYVEGGELFDYLVSRRRIHADEALHYFQQIISAISYCHGFNIAHRDLKPENLLLSKSGTCQNIKVADFGMAAYTDPLALLSTSCGSPHYASPEVIEGKSYKGNVSDIWSCGVILYALLVGRLPFDHENLRVLLAKVKMAKYETPKDIPAAARDLISRMLEKDVTQRITVRIPTRLIDSQMTQILKHPFFLSTTPSPSLLLSVQTPTLYTLSSKTEKAIHSEDDIDADIFDNLRTLWHGTPASHIIDGLLSSEKTWEKAVYYLLLKYRSKHLERYNIDEDDELRQRRRQSLKAEVPKPLLGGIQGAEESCEASNDDGPIRTSEQITSTASPSQAEATSPATARPVAPTPQRAVGQGSAMIIGSDTDDISSAPRHECLMSSPIAPQHPALDIGTDVFTATPRGYPIASTLPGPRSLPLPMLPELSATDYPALPMINLQEATPMPIEQVPIQHDLNSNASSASGPSPILGLPGIVMPNLDNVDETVQRFFRQIVEHLNYMQMWQSMVSASTRSSSATPEPSIRNASGMTFLSPRPGPHEVGKVIKDQATAEQPNTMSASSKAGLDLDHIRFQDATEESDASSNPATNLEILGLGISGNRQGSRKRHPDIRPPIQQQQLRPPPPGRVYSPAGYNAAKHTPTIEKRSQAEYEDKENISVQKDTVESDSVPLRQKSSLRNSEDKKNNLTDKRVHILLPTQETEEPKSKPKKVFLSTSSAETSPGLSDGSFLPPAGTIPRRSWFANLFKFKPASYHLLSVHDAYTTKEECVRVLRGFGVTVMLDADGHDVLRCKLIRDPASVMAAAKAVRFRVELHHVTHAHSVSGYMTSLTMIREKGALSSFRLVYNRLRREWDLDTPPTRTTSSVY
ncbi:kinase-like domain-containing protein [Gautieria morchelliformis]|nr:kinase-like domain-containing protein [Gautieria morchelliformis]